MQIVAVLCGHMFPEKDTGYVVVKMRLESHQLKSDQVVEGKSPRRSSGGGNKEIHPLEQRHA